MLKLKPWLLEKRWVIYKKIRNFNENKVKPVWWSDEDTSVHHEVYELTDCLTQWQDKAHLTTGGDFFDADLYKRCKEIKDIL